MNNVGTFTATQVVITDVLPAYMFFVTETTGLAVAAEGPPLTYTWTLTDNLAPGQGFTFTLSRAGHRGCAVGQD